MVERGMVDEREDKKRLAGMESESGGVNESAGENEDGSEMERMKMSVKEKRRRREKKMRQRENHRRQERRNLRVLNKVRTQGSRWETEKEWGWEEDNLHMHF